ncbi:MAG TPA: tRNA pseudouridine(38-40) synthase TruA [Polyangiaceae bacterium]|nr:tRNA pseudouridine(38-40) synthase TruA [Polyangiaceae bacterium]
MNQDQTADAARTANAALASTEGDRAANTPEPHSSRSVLLTVAYDGSNFAGYAAQTNARTVAGELLGAIRALDPKVKSLRGTSRTDAGVHARGQLVAFDTGTRIPARGWVLGLGPHLPKEIAIVRAALVPEGFEPRRHVVRKTYRYVLLRSAVRDPFLESRAWRITDRLNHTDMQRAADALLGEHDFAAFRGAADERENTVRRMFRVEVRTARSDERILEIVVEGDRFLYRMVRIIAGTLVDVGRGRLDPGVIGRAIASKRREDLGITAPPDGLFLDRIELDEAPGECFPPREPGKASDQSSD